MVVVIVIIADNKINRMTMETAAILNNHILSHRHNKHPQLVVLKTLMQLVSFLSVHLGTSLTDLDGGYANYAQLWYQALAAQGAQSQSDPAKPPGTS